MEEATFVSANSPGGVGGFQISYGSKLRVPNSGDRLNAARNLASKVSPKLRYRGKYEEYEEWRKTIILLAHSLRIQLGLDEPSEASLRRSVKYVDMGEKPTTEFEIEFDSFKAAFNENSTMIFELIFGAIDFTGPMAAADANYINAHLRDFENGYSWGHYLWADVEARSGGRIDTSAAKHRQEVADNTKWVDARDNRTLLISRISSKFFAWCADPRNKAEDVTGFIKPYLLDHFPVSPGEDALVKMEGHIQSYLKGEPSLKLIVSNSDKEYWIRLFLSRIDEWGISHGIPDGNSGGGDLMLPFSEQKPDKEKPPLMDSCKCLECDCWACNGVGFLAGEGRDKCLCYMTVLRMPKGATENQKRAVMSCRTFLTYEPDFSPNIKALPMREIFARVKAHVKAEKAAKEAAGSFKTIPNPGRSDPSGRFHQSQSNAPMVDEGAQYNDDLAECMRLHDLNISGIGDVHAPLAETGAAPLTPGEKWEAEMEGHEEEVLEEISSSEAMAALHAEIEGFKARERAAQQDALRAAPGTREDYFKTPAATSNLTQFSRMASDPLDRMRQLQFAEKTPMPKPSPATSKKPPLSGTAMVGKALNAFEDEKQAIQLTADSPWNAIKVLLKSSGNFLLSAIAGRSLLALAAVFVLRYRSVLLRKLVWKFWQMQGTASFVLQWALAKTVLSAQHRAKLFFQAGLERVGGQVAPLDSQWLQAPALADVGEETPHSSSGGQLDELGNDSEGGLPPVTRSFTPVLPPVPGSPASPSVDVKHQLIADRSAAEATMAVPPSLSMSQIVEAAIADALAKQQVMFASALSEKVASVIAQAPGPGKSLSVAAAGALSDQGGQDVSFSRIKPLPDAGGQSITGAVPAPSAPIETEAATASPDGESSPAVTVNVSGGETIAMMSDGAVFNSLSDIQDALRKKGGGIAMSDSGCTFTAMMPAERIGIIDKTFVKNAVPVTIGDSSSVTFSGTDLYCCKMGGHGQNAYDVLFRAGTYPANGIGNVMSGTILQSIFDFSSSPGGGLSFSLPGSPPLTPVIAPNSTAFLTLTPLVGPRCAALYRKAIRNGMDTRDIHFMVVIPSPVDGPGVDDTIMAAIDTRPVRGSLVDNPEALELFSGPYTRKDSYVSMLEANGVPKAVPVDKDPVHGGGEEHNILTNSFLQYKLTTLDKAVRAI